MTTDSQNKEKRLRIPDWWELPKIKDIRIRRVRYQAKKYKYIKSDYTDHDEAIELMVEYEGDFQVSRAVGPILYIGDIPVGEVEFVDKKHARFLAFRPKQFQKDAPISIGWPGELKRRKKTGFQFKMDG
jgi:hypothetical protein